MKKTKQRKYKTIFTLRVMMLLKDCNIEPLFETDNNNKPGFKCWVYEVTPQFETSFSRIMRGK